MALRTISMLLLVAGLGGCYYDNEEELYPGRFCEVGVATDAGYYAATVEPILQSRCAIPGCHVPGGTGPGDFNQYTEVKAKVDAGSFQQQVLQSRAMPPSGPLPSCELLKLQAWLDAGAPN